MKLVSMKDTKELITEEFIKQFNLEGHRVSLDRVSKALHISKKTIYKNFGSKEEIYEYLLEDAADDIHKKQKAIFEDPSLSTHDKLVQILTIKTKRETQVNIVRMSEMKDYEPLFYSKVLLSYEKQWDYFASLVEIGKKDGTLKENTNTAFLIGVLSSGMETLYKEGFLTKSRLSYTAAIKLLEETVMEGCFKR